MEPLRPFDTGDLRRGRIRRRVDRLAFDWSRQRAVTVALGDGTAVAVRTDTGVDLDRRTAARAGEGGSE